MAVADSIIDSCFFLGVLFMASYMLVFNLVNNARAETRWTRRLALGRPWTPHRAMYPAWVIPPPFVGALWLSHSTTARSRRLHTPRPLSMPVPLSSAVGTFLKVQTRQTGMSLLSPSLPLQVATWPIFRVTGV